MKSHGTHVSVTAVMRNTCSYLCQTPTSFKFFLEERNIFWRQFVYFNFCCSIKSVSVVPAFSEVVSYLVVQLKHFVSYDNQVIKAMKHVQCTPNISVPVKDKEVTHQKDFNLIVIISQTRNSNLHQLLKFLIQNYGFTPMMQDIEPFWDQKIIQEILTKFTKILNYIKSSCIIFCAKLF